MKSDRPPTQTGMHGAPASPSATFDSQPPAVPDHELLKKIGDGSYGEVWLARNALGTLRAIKIVHRKTFWSDHPFEREFNGIQKFEPISRSHEGMVDILQIGRGDGYFYYVMELADSVSSFEFRVSSSTAAPAAQRQLETPNPKPETYSARTLTTDLARHRRLPPAECIRIGLALTDALAHLHRHGLVHRDIKPANIIFVGGVAKLADIGLVAEVSEARSYVGTEGFIPPEGPGTPQADLYSLGKLLYEIGTGQDRHAFPALPSDLAEQSEVPQLVELNAILLKACQPDPRERYDSAEAMQTELELLQRGESVKVRRTVQRRVTLAKNLSVVAILITLLFTSVVFLSHRQSEQKRIRRQEAAKLYQEGRRYADQRTKAGFTRAVDLFNQAIAIDPNSAPAYLGLADTHLSVSGWDRSPREAMPTARSAALKALELNANSAEAHLCLGRVKWHYDWDWASTEAEFKQAIRLEPKNAVNHVYYAQFLTCLGRMDEGRAEMDLAESLSPPSHQLCYSYGLRLYFNRQYEKGIAQALRGLALETNSFLNHSLLMDCYLTKAMYPEATAEAQKLRSLDDSPYVVAKLGYLYATTGQTNEARQCLAQLERDSTTRHVSAYFRGFIHLGLDEKDEALACLEQAYEERFGWMTNLKVDPEWDGLRAEPRFDTLLRKMKLER